jgi:hypothetical protein
LIPLGFVLSAIALFVAVCLGTVVAAVIAAPVVWLLNLRGQRSDGTVDAIVIAASFAIGVFVTVLVFNGVRMRMSDGAFRALVGTPILLLLAAGLFALKTSRLATYGFLELGFGVAVVATTLWGLADRITSTQLLSLLAACYLVIRALDNLTKAGYWAGLLQWPSMGNRSGATIRKPSY